MNYIKAALKEEKKAGNWMDIINIIKTKKNFK